MKNTINIKQYLKVGLISLGILSSYTSFIYSIGQSKESQKTGIELKERFSIRAFKLNEEEFNTIDKSIQLSNIYLAKFSQESIPNGITLYKIHQLDLNNPFAIREVGTINSQKIKIDSNSPTRDFIDLIDDSAKEILDVFSLIPKAHAQSIFNWNGYERNYNFYELYINNNTVRRHYQDGAILEYKISSQGLSIPTSFKWIERA